MGVAAIPLVNPSEPLFPAGFCGLATMPEKAYHLRQLGHHLKKPRHNQLGGMQWIV